MESRNHCQMDLNALSDSSEPFNENKYSNKTDKNGSKVTDNTSPTPLGKISILKHR